MSAKTANTRKPKSTKRTRKQKSGKRVSLPVTDSQNTYSVRPAIFQMDIYDFGDYPSSDYQRKYAD